MKIKKMSRDKGIFIIFNIFIIFMLLMAYWKIIFMKNIMKWDIFTYHYPNYYFISSCLKHGILPLWNPFLNYGFPEFAQMGTPLWYPTTLVICLIGSNMFLIHLEHIFHLYLASLFMFILLKNAVFKSYRSKDVISIFGAIIYPFIGFFISGAQDIMLTISAAWVPLTLYLFYKALHSKKMFDFILVGIPLGLIILGGYPSLLFILGIIMVLWYIIYFFIFSKNKITIKNIIYPIRNYLIIMISTFLNSAILLIPGLQTMKYMTRGKLEYSVAMFGSNSPINLLTMFIPGYSVYFKLFDKGPNDLLMVSYYTSILVLILSVYALKKSGNNKKISLYLLACIFLILSFGVYSFPDEITRHIIPMFNTFKWPGIYRLFYSMILIILAGIGFDALLYDKQDYLAKLMMSFVKVLCIILLCIFIFKMFLIANPQSNGGFNTNFPMLINSNFVDTVIIQLIIIIGIVLSYYIIIINKNSVSYRRFVLYLAIVLSFELLHFCYSDFYTTIAFKDNGFFDMSEVNVADYVKKSDEIPKNAFQVNDYNIYTDNFYENSKIIFPKKIESNGYNSFQLKNTNKFKTTQFNDKVKLNNVIYLSSNITTLQDENSIISKLNEQKDKSGIIINKINYIDNYTSNVQIKKMENNNNIKLDKIVEDDSYYIDVNIVINTQDSIIKFFDNDGKILSQYGIIGSGNSNFRYNIPRNCKDIKVENCLKNRILKSRIGKLNLVSEKKHEIIIPNSNIDKFVNCNVANNDNSVIISNMTNNSYVNFNVNNAEVKYNLILSFDLSMENKNECKLLFYSGQNKQYFEKYSETAINENTRHIEVGLLDNTTDIKMTTDKNLSDLKISNIKLKYSLADADERIIVNEFKANSINLTINNNEELNYLTLLQSNYPGWYAKIDGKNTEIQTSNLNFISVQIPKGKHNIEFKFKPKAFYLGASISILYYIILIIIFIKGLKMRKSEQLGN